MARASDESARLSGIATWTQSYFVDETDGTIGSICIYDAVSPEAVRHHSDAAELPVDEIVKVGDIIVARPHPPRPRLERGERDGWVPEEAL